MARKRKRGLGSTSKTHVTKSHRGSRSVARYIAKASMKTACSLERLQALKDAAVAYGYTLAHEKSSSGRAHIGRRMQVLARELKSEFNRYERDCDCRKSARPKGY